MKLKSLWPVAHPRFVRFLNSLQDGFKARCQQLSGLEPVLCFSFLIFLGSATSHGAWGDNRTTLLIGGINKCAASTSKSTLLPKSKIVNERVLHGCDLCRNGFMGLEKVSWMSGCNLIDPTSYLDSSTPNSISASGVSRKEVPREGSEENAENCGEKFAHKCVWRKIAILLGGIIAGFVVSDIMRRL